MTNNQAFVLVLFVLGLVVFYLLLTMRLTNERIEILYERTSALQQYSRPHVDKEDAADACVKEDEEMVYRKRSIL